MKCNNLIDSILVNGAYVVMPFIVMLSATIFFSNQITTILGDIGASPSEFINMGMIQMLLSMPSTIYAFLFNMIASMASEMHRIDTLINALTGCTFYIGESSVCYASGLAGNPLWIESLRMQSSELLPYSDTR